MKLIHCNSSISEFLWHGVRLEGCAWGLEGLTDMHEGLKLTDCNANSIYCRGEINRYRRLVGEGFKRAEV